MRLSKRIYTSQALNEKPGAKVILAGWAEKIKVMGKLAFITLRDREGKIQLTFLEKEFGSLRNLNELTIESVISVEGKIKKSKLKSGDNEVIVKKLEILNKAETPLPISIHDKNIETEFSKRLDNRFLDLRNSKQLAIFIIRQSIILAIREFLFKNNFIEMHTPKISEAGAEGGATLFPVNYFGKKAYLSQSQQIYKQIMMSSGFEKVFEIGPSFRAEKSHTTRHLTEFTHLDVELSFIDSFDDVLKLGERLLVYVLKYVSKNCKKELKLLKRKLEIPKLPFPRISYAKALELLNSEKIKIKYGQEIDLEKEKILANIIRKKYKTDAYFIFNIPWEQAKFYWMKKDNIGLGGDLEYIGQEIFTGSQREHRPEILIKQIREKGLKVKDFESYLQPFRYGCPPHGGFGLGVDRLTALICSLQNIREAILFPRDPERLKP